MRYHANVSPRSLSTVRGNPVTNYPARWELLQWYRCWRKIPYPSEISAALLVEGRTGAYAHYPCPLDPRHWHIGRGGNTADPRQLTQRAKRVYRKAVRDEIWAEHEERANVVRQEGEARA